MEVVAKCSYNPLGNTALSFSVDDVIKVKEINNTGLWKGEINDKVGYFYVSMTKQKNPPLYIGKVIKKFTSDYIDCLKIEINDIVSVYEENNDWLYCSFGIEFGYIPSIYVEKLNIGTKRLKQSGVKQTVIGVIQPTILPCRIIGLYDYVATSDKEVSFYEGDEMICLLSDTKWLYVQHPLYGLGYIPTTYVQYEKVIYTDDISAFGVVLFDYEGDTRYHLSVQAGDVVFVIKIIGSWALVKVNERKYIIPFSYIKILTNESIDENMGFVLYDFIAKENNELTVNANDFVVILYYEDNGWVLVQKNNDIGYIPLKYICHIKNNDSYVVVNQTTDDSNISSNTIENDVKKSNISNMWLFDSKIDESLIQICRNDQKSIVNTNSCNVIKFKKPIKQCYVDGRNQINSKMIEIESARDEKDALIRERRAEEYKQKQKVEQQTFLRQTMRTKKKTSPIKSSISSSLSSSSDSILLDLQKMKSLYDSVASNNLDSTSTPKTTFNHSPKPSKQRTNSLFLNNRRNRGSHPLTNSSITTSTLSERAEIGQQLSSSCLRQSDSCIDEEESNKQKIIEDLVKENISLKEQVSSVESSQKNLLRLVYVLQKEIKEMRDEQESQIQQELKQSQQEIERLKKITKEI
ncbi:SH3 domain-containing protein [Entamoeba marina]